jgi:hypothetical protein
MKEEKKICCWSKFHAVKARNIGDTSTAAD